MNDAVRATLIGLATSLAGCIGAAWIDLDRGQRILTWRPGLPGPDADGSPTRALSATALRAAERLLACGPRPTNAPAGVESVLVPVSGGLLLVARERSDPSRVVAFLCDRMSNMGAMSAHATHALLILPTCEEPPP